MTYLNRIDLVLVVFGVDLQIFNVNIRQSADEQLQLLFVEYGNQSFRNYVVETFQKGVQSAQAELKFNRNKNIKNQLNVLLLDRAAHLELAHQMNVEQFILFGHHNVTAVRYQITDGRHAELLHLQAERMIVAQRRHMVFHQEHQTLVEFVILTFHVLCVHLNAQNVLVK